MTPLLQWSRLELIDELESHNQLGPDEIAGVWLGKVNKALARGDRFLVYINADLGSPDVGLLWGCSYGSQEALLDRTVFTNPPTKAPDMVGMPPMWRYQLYAEVIDAAG